MIKSGDRQTAATLMRGVLRLDCRFVPAWLWMSELVDSPVHQKECLECALTLDPQNVPARRGLELLRLREAADATASDIFTYTKTPIQSRRLGEYLIDRGLITAAQLEEALTRQRLEHRSLQGVRVPLGDILVGLGYLTPQMLATFLVEQQQERVERESPVYLGEYLVAQGLLTHEQFERVLARQIALHQGGRRILLGDLLISAGYLTPEALDQVLAQQREAVWAQFGGTDGQDEDS
jgi:hypothetical protein